MEAVGPGHVHTELAGKRGLANLASLVVSLGPFVDSIGHTFRECPPVLFSVCVEPAAGMGGPGGE